MKSRVSWSYESNELLDVVESFLHNIVTPCPQLCGRHTGGLHHPLSFAIWQRNAAALLIIRFLYKGIIINHNKKLSQPTLKRRFFKKKAAFFSWPGLGKEWC